MKIVFASHGSMGDLVPFLEIGKVLEADGHRVVVATHEAHRAVVKAAGLALAPMRPDRPGEPAFHRRFMAPHRGPAFIYKSYLGPAIADSEADLLPVVAGADILVSVTLALAAPLVAARTGIPWRSAAFQPAMLYSAIDPPKLAMLPFIRGRPRYNAWLMDAARRGVESWATALRAHRRASGLGEYADHPAFHGQHSPDGVLALYSPLFGAIPADAPPGTVSTGQVLQSGGRDLDPALADFLAAGPAPVVFTLGSASSHAARGFFGASLAIARRLGVRALLLTGTAPPEIPPGDARQVMAVASAPYHLVFPHARAVVHQGGIGTIALCIASGTPMLLVPFAHDQPDNAARAERAGLARVAPRWRYASGGARALDTVLADVVLRENIAVAQRQIVAEAGAKRAAAEILRAAQEAR